MKKIIMISILMSLNIGYANVSIIDKSDINYKKLRTFEKTSNQLTNKNKNNHITFKEKGYRVDDGNEVESFLERKEYGTTRPEDLNMAYPYLPIVKMCQDPIIAASGTIIICDDYIVTIGMDEGSIHIEGKGWTGATETFTHPVLGMCKYTENNAQLSKSSVFIEKDRIDNYIGDIPVLKDAHGNPQIGFLYEASWFTKNYFRTIKCAKRGDYDSRVMETIDTIAQDIERINH